MIESYAQWELLSRSTQAVATTVMVAGICSHAGSFVLPFLLWLPVQVVVNLAMMASAVRREDKTCLMLGVMVCLDVYGWGVAYSGRQQMVLDDILDAKFERHLRTSTSAAGRTEKEDEDETNDLSDEGRKHRSGNAGKRIKGKIKGVIRNTKRNIQ